MFNKRQKHVSVWDQPVSEPVARRLAQTTPGYPPTRDGLIAFLQNNASHGDLVMAEIQIRQIEAMESADASQTRSANVLTWLTWVLVFLTVIITVATVVLLVRS